MFSFDLNLKLSSPFWIHCYVVVLPILLHFPCGYFNNGFHCLPSSRIFINGAIYRTSSDNPSPGPPNSYWISRWKNRSLSMELDELSFFVSVDILNEISRSIEQLKQGVQIQQRRQAGHLRILMRLSLISLTYILYHCLWFRQTPSSTSRPYPQSSTSGSITPHFPKSNYRSLMMRILKDGRPRLNSTSKCTIPAK